MRRRGKKTKRVVILSAGFLSCMLLSVAIVYAIDDLTGGWNLNEGTGSLVYDSSGNGNDGTMIGGCTWVDGKYEKGLHFDGTTGYVEIPHNQLLNSANFTIEAWVFLDADVGNTQWRIASKQWSVGNAYSLDVFGKGYFGCSGNQLVLSIGNGSYYVNLISTTHLSNNTWYHVAGTHEGMTSKLYINGVLDKNGTTTTQTINIARFLTIGCCYQTGKQPEFFFNGTIDEVKIYNRALSASELQADIIPEFTSLLIVPAFMIATLFAVIVKRKKPKVW
jgi:hypothetical protein